MLTPLKRKSESPPPGRSPHAASGRRKYSPEAQDGAARKIRTWFVKLVQRSNKGICSRFLGPDGPPTLEFAFGTKMQFDKLSETLRRRDVIEASGDMLLRVIQLCNWGRGDKPLVTGTVNAKIYLAAYMIAVMPKNVFDEIGELEQGVIDASKPLIGAFHELAQCVNDGKHWKEASVAKTLPTLLCTYLRSFKEWKISDEKKLAGRLRRALAGIENQLNKTRAAQEAGEGDFSLDIKELDEQKRKLEAKLRQIGGSSEPSKPRPLNGATGARAATVVRTHNVQDLGAGSGSVTGSMTNEQLAHELLVDPGFRLDDRAGMSDEKLVHTKIRETFERAFWDSLVEDLTCDPPSFAPVLNVLAEIKCGIANLGISPIAARQINDIVDVPHIAAQLRAGVLDIMGCHGLIDSIVGVILGIHDRMKSAERREETAAKWRECAKAFPVANAQGRAERAKAVCGGLELVLDRLHKVRVDIANNKLRAISPVIQQHGIEYEKSHIAKKLDSGAITMERTEAWLAYEVEALLAQQRRAVVDLRSLDIDVSDKYRAVIRMGLVDLVADYPNWGGVKRGKAQEDDLPESLMLDLLRVKALRAHILIDATSAVILTQVEQECKNRVRDAAARAKILKAATDIVLKDPPRLSQVQTTIDAVMEQIEPHMADADRTVTRALLVKHVAPAHPVFVHVLKQFRLAWYHVLAGSEYTMKIPESAQCMHKVTIKHAKFLRVVSVLNLAVHTNRYNEMLGRMLDRMLGGILGAPAAVAGSPEPLQQTQNVQQMVDELVEARISAEDKADIPGLLLKDGDAQKLP